MMPELGRIERSERADETGTFLRLIHLRPVVDVGDVVDDDVVVDVSDVVDDEHVVADVGDV